MFAYWKKLDELTKVNRILIGVIGLLFVIIFILSFSLAKAPKYVRFFVTPTLSTQGGELKANQVPESSVFSFVSTLLPLMNSWSGEDVNELKKNVYAYQHYLTPRHRALLSESIKAYKNAGLFNHAQTASLYQSFEKRDVEQIGPNLWRVKVLLRLTQRLNNKNPLVISDKVIAYSIRVSRVSLSREQNPFELALDGYGEPEVLYKNLLDEEGESHV